jgi:Skp family chaperone for outer membrane proteins
MKTLIKISVFFGIILFSSSLQSSELTQEFKNPSFSGQGYSNHVLSVDQLERQRKQKIKEDKEAAERQAKRDEDNKTINRFIANVESRIYANLSKQLVDNMFGDTGQNSGTAEIEGAQIVWTKDTDLGTINITITAEDGTVTTLTVPIGDFGF